MVKVSQWSDCQHLSRQIPSLPTNLMGVSKFDGPVGLRVQFLLQQGSHGATEAMQHNAAQSDRLADAHPLTCSSFVGLSQFVVQQSSVWVHGSKNGPLNRCVWTSAEWRVSEYVGAWLRKGWYLGLIVAFAADGVLLGPLDGFWPWNNPTDSQLL